MVINRAMCRCCRRVALESRSYCLVSESARPSRCVNVGWLLKRPPQRSLSVSLSHVRIVAKAGWRSSARVCRISLWRFCVMCVRKCGVRVRIVGCRIRNVELFQP